MSKDNAIQTLAGSRETAEGFTGKYNGVKYVLSLTEGIDGQDLSIEIRREFPLILYLEKEEGSTFSRRIGLTRKIRTGDALFDSKVNTVANDPSVARAFLGEMKRKDALNEIFAAWPEIESVSYMYGNCTFTFRGIILDPDGSKIAAMVKTCVAACDEPGPLPEEKSSWMPFFFLVFNMLVLIAGFVLASLTPRHILTLGTLRDKVYLWTGVSFLIYLLPAIIVSRGRADSHIRLGFFLITASFGFFIFYTGFFESMNVRLDKSIPEVRTALVTDVKVERIRRTTIRSLILLPEGESSTYVVPAERDFFMKTSPGDRLKMYTRKGRFGMPWISLKP